jgi:hypothetical protein
MTVTYYDGPLKAGTEPDVEPEPGIEEPPVHPASPSEIIDEIKEEARRAGADSATGEMTGRPNYAAISESRKEHWVIELAVNLFEWRQRAVQYHGEGMLAKVIRQEVFTEGYLERTGRSTVDDRTQAGQRASLQDYYFAVLCARLSEHAKAACAIAELICQRLKDFCGR